MLGHGPLSSGPLSAVVSGTALRVAPDGLSSAEAFGSPTVENLSARQLILPAGLASAEVFGEVRLALVIAPAGIVSGEAFGAAVAVPGAVSIQPGGLLPAAAFGVVAVSVGTATLRPSGVASGEAFGTAIVANRRQIVSPSGWALFSDCGVPALQNLRRTLVPAGIVSAEAFGTPTLTVRLTGARWRPVVTLDGDDVSADLVSALRIEAEEGAARIAEFTLQLAPGTVLNLPAYVGKSVTIDYADQIDDGAAGNAVRLFSGVIDLPEYDFADRTIACRCTDDLQGTVAALTRAEVEALVGGEYSTAVFEPTADVWRYAQDRLSTVPAALDLSPAGVPRLTAWAAKADADLTYGEAQVLFDASVGVSLANREQIRNRVEIAFAYRFPRCKRRVVSASYAIPGGFGDFLAGSYWALTREAVQTALGGLGWSIVGGSEGINFTPLPASGTYFHGTDPLTWVNLPSVTAGLCLGFSASLSKCWTQTVEERYTITVENAESVARLGALPESRSAALEVKWEQGAWEAEANRQPTGGRYLAYEAPPAVPALPIPTDEIALDYSPSPTTDRSAAEEAIRALVAEAQTRIFAAHRQNAVNCVVALDPLLDVDKTVAIDTPNLAARGKLRAVTHEMDLESGDAVSSIEIAICSLAGLGWPHPADDPEAPATPEPPGPGDDASYECTISYGHLPDDEHQLVIDAPAVDDQSRDNAVLTVTQAYAAAINEDLFEVTA